MYQASSPYWYFQMVWPMEQTSEMASKQPNSTRIWKLVIRSTLDSFRGGRVEFWVKDNARLCQQLRCGSVCNTCVHYLHEFCVMPRVDHHTVHPLSVPELGSSQQDLVRTKWYCAAGRNATTDLNKQLIRFSTSRPYIPWADCTDLEVSLRDCSFMHAN